MTSACPMQPCSSKRAALASFDHAYAVAIRMRHATGHPQFVLRTGDPLQPFRVSSRSEEQTSELQSLMRISYAVCCWKKTKESTCPSNNKPQTQRTIILTKQG